MSDAIELRVLYVGNEGSVACARSAQSKESEWEHLDPISALSRLRSVPPRSEYEAAMAELGWPPERNLHSEELPECAHAADRSIKATLKEVNYDVLWLGPDTNAQHEGSGLSYFVLLLFAAIDRRIPAVVVGFKSDRESSEASGLVYGLFRAQRTRVYFEYPNSIVKDIDWFIRRIRDDTKTSS